MKNVCKYLEFGNSFDNKYPEKCLNLSQPYFFNESKFLRDLPSPVLYFFVNIAYIHNEIN